MPQDFTWKQTPKKVKRYFVELLGTKKAKALMDAMWRYQWIIIGGPSGPTGKSTLADVLRTIGYTRVIEEWESTSIQICDPLTELREKSEIFESLGIDWKC